MQDSTHTFLSSARRFFSGTALSRITGFAREVVMAAAFGTAPAVAAFWMAFRFAYLFRRLFGEGGLHVAFVPHFESLRKSNVEHAAAFFFDLSKALTYLLLLLVLLAEAILASFLLFAHLSPGNSDVVRLTIVLLPALLFICLYALNSSLLNCQQSYFLPSAAPTLLNLIWLMTIGLLLYKGSSEPMLYLAMALVFAFALQWLVTLPSTYAFLRASLGKKWGQNKEERMGREIVRLLRPFLLALVGVAATQINSAVDALFARAASLEGPAYLWYALRLQQLPLALFGVGLTGALLPPLARALEEKDNGKYHHFLSLALRQTVIYMVPITAAIFALGFVSVNLVYGRGAFQPRAIAVTTPCLWAYGAGLVPMTFVLIFASAFYAQKEYRIPSLLSLAAVLLNVALNTLFVYGLHLGALSVALATTVSSIFNALFLAYFLRRKSGELPQAPFLKITFASLLAAAVTILCSHYYLHDNTLSYLLSLPLFPFPRHYLTQAGLFFGQTALFFTIFFLLAKTLRAPLPSLKKESA